MATENLTREQLEEQLATYGSMLTHWERLWGDMNTTLCKIETIIEFDNSDPRYELWEVGDLHRALYAIRRAVKGEE